MINTVQFARDVDTAWVSAATHIDRVRAQMRSAVTVLNAERMRRRNLAETERQLIGHAPSLRDDIGW